MALTKVTGHVIKSDTNITSHNINSSGIVTAVTFDGNFTGVAVTFTGDSTIGSLGITTNLNVGGISTFTGNIDANGDIDVDGHTNLDNVSVSGVSTFAGNADFSAGIDVTGHATVSQSLTVSGGYVYAEGGVHIENSDPRINLVDTNGNPDYHIRNSGGALVIRNTTNGVNNLVINSGGEAVFGGNAVIPGNLSVGGVLTYQDVTNIDSIGIVTARSDIRGGRNLSVVGIVTANQIKFADSNFGASTNQLRFGSSDDMLIYHDGNNSVIKNQTNDLYIETVGSGDDIIIKSADDLLLQVAGTEDGIKIIGDGAVELYHNNIKKAETNTQGLLTPNTLGICFGDGGCKVSGTAGSGSSAGLFFMTNSSTKWQIDGDGHFKPNAVGSYNIGSTGAEIGNVYLADSKNIYIGSDQDVYFNHSGVHAQIKNTTGNFYFDTELAHYIRLGSGNEAAITATHNSSVDLYYDGGTYTTPKLKTSATGITVDGEVATTQDYPNVRPLLDLNFAATKKLDPRITYKRTGPASFIDQDGKVVLVGDNAPRFDHDPDTRESKGLLIEESRTNYLKYSVDFASVGGYNANYSNARSTLTSTTEVAPDGTNTARKYVRTSGQGAGEVAIIINPLGLNSGVVYTTSLFVKLTSGANSNIVELVNTRADSSNSGSTFNLSTGVIVTDGSQNTTAITKFPNGWFRLSVTATANSGGYFWVRTGTGGQNQNEGDGFILWGGQVEAGAFPTSYIPTYDNASVTRGLDIVTIDKDDIDGIFNPEEGTMFYEAAVTNLTNDNQPIAAFRDVSNTAASYHAMGHAIGGSAGSVRTWARNAASTNIHLTAHTGLVAGSFYKHMYGYKYNDYSDAFGQGTTLKQTNTTSGNHAMNAPGLVDELRFGGYYTSPENNYSLDSGHIKRFSYWPIKLTNTQIKTYVS